MNKYDLKIIDGIRIIDYISVVKPEGISRSADEDHKYKQIADQVNHPLYKNGLVNSEVLSTSRGITGYIE